MTMIKIKRNRKIRTIKKITITKLREHDDNANIDNKRHR